MVISRDVSAFRNGMGIGLKAFGRWLVIPLGLAGLCVALVVSPVMAKYSPPQAAMVVDLYSGEVLYQQNPDALRYPASITKVMTLYLLFEQIRDGNMSLDTRLKVSKEAASRPPSKLGLKPGSTISVKDAMYALVTKSANDVAAVVAENIAGSEAAFGRMMTQKARAIGMSKTTFRNASGLPNTKQKSTARDLITLGRHVLKDFPEHSKIFRTRYFKYGERRFRNHNRLLFNYAGMDGMKTGFTRASGFNLLASCRRSDKHLLAVVLGGRSSKHRNGRMRTLLNRSWRKAVAFNELQQRGSLKPLAIAGILQPGHMPKRNPAFHGTPAEREMRLRLAEERAARRKAEQQFVESARQIARAEATPERRIQFASVAPSSETAEGDARDDTDPASLRGPYHVQVGSYLDSGSAQSRLVQVSSKASSLLSGHDDFTVSGRVRGKTYYRARFGRFSESDASNTCSRLKRMKIDCLVVRVD